MQNLNTLNTKVKQGFVALFAFALMMGMTAKADAISINPNDLILVLYGNGTEYYQKIGQIPDVTSAPGTQTFNIAGPGVSAAGPASSTLWTLVSFNTSDATFSGDPTTASFTFKGPTPPTTISADAIWGNLGNWAGNVSIGSVDPNSGTFPKSDTVSFFNQVDSGNGDGRFGGLLPAGTSAAGLYGNTLTILDGDFNNGQVTSTGYTATLSLINPANLALGATLSLTAPSPVPVPASVVLFATGLLGLIGLSRRRQLLSM